MIVWTFLTQSEDYTKIHQTWNGITSKKLTPDPALAITATVREHLTSTGKCISE